MKYFRFSVLLVIAISIQTTAMYAQATFFSSIDDDQFTNTTFGFGGVDKDVKKIGWLTDAYSMANNNYLKGINTVAASIPSFDSLANSIYIELISVNTKNLPLRFSLGSQVALKNDSIPDEQVAKLVAYKKMLSGGGNIVVNISTPIAYINKEREFLPQFYVAAHVSGYLDLKNFNQLQASPATGFQGSVETDLRILSAKLMSDTKNNLNFGIRGKAIWNFVNNQFSDKYSTNYNLNNIKLTTASVYLKYGAFDLQYTLSWAPTNIMPSGASGGMGTVSFTPWYF